MTDHTNFWIKLGQGLIHFKYFSFRHFCLNLSADSEQQETKGQIETKGDIGSWNLNQGSCIFEPYLFFIQP